MQRHSRHVIAYLLITSGPRHVPDISKEPAARTQIRALEMMASKLDASLKIVAWDYARKITSLNDLPQLFKALQTMKQSSEDGTGSGQIVIDSYSRLFRAATPKMQSELWSALIEYEEHFRDVQTRKSLCDLSSETALLVKMGNMPRLEVGRQTAVRSEKQRQAQTESARVNSALVRKQRAEDAVRQLQQAFDAYKDDIPGASLKAFIDSDAAKTVRNSLGRAWTYSSAKRALRELRNRQP
ncbi:MAG: hypothetical protein JJ869_17450 [Marivita sp.]|uniref:hypothetical protein n=1 Tax=Marivita sp. TaxID=2003365 RepID=UPI001B2AC45F|nr:hypothetical protein [Marivita sp.]MBO6885343.1 hypothetical protein [Marivita sp.]